MADQQAAPAADPRAAEQRVAHPLEPPGAPIAALAVDGLDEARLQLEQRLREPELDLEMRPLTEYRDLLWSQFRPGPVVSLAWPAGWHIPVDADFQQHWPFPPPAANRYDWASANAIGGQPAGSHASHRTGLLFAWNNASRLGPAYVGFARTGILLRPPETLATYRLGADIDVVTETRWWYLPGPGGGYGTVSYRCTAFLAVWQVSPADGSWELVRPFGARTLVRTQQIGAGAFPVDSDRHAFDDLTVDVQLQGGRTYAIGVSFEVAVTTAILDGQGRPYAPKPEDDIRLWASMLGTVPRITASPHTVWIA